MVFVGYIKLVWPLLILSFISATALFFIIFPERKFLMKKNLDKINFRGKTAAILIQYKWLIVAFSTLVPFIVSKNLASPRTAIYFMYFILIFIFIFSFRFLKFNSLQLSSLEVNKKTKITAYILVFLTVISSLILTTYNFKRGLLLKSSIVERELKLKSAKGKIIKINLIDPCLSTYCYKFSDFSLIDSEEYNWIKESQERYFGIKKIIVTE